MIGLLKSRKFWIGISALIAVVAMQFGISESKAEELSAAVLTVAGLLIGGIAIEDAGAKIAGKKQETKQ